MLLANRSFNNLFDDMSVILSSPVLMTGVHLK